MAEYPDIELKEVFTGWDFTEGGDIAVQEFTAADYDGVWTSGIDYTVVNAFETAGKEPVPVVGADNNGFIKQLLDGTPGALVTNPAVIGGVGTTIALRRPQRRGARADHAADAAGVGPREQPGRARGELLPGSRRHVQLGRHRRGLHHLRRPSSSSTARVPGSDPTPSLTDPCQPDAADGRPADADSTAMTVTTARRPRAVAKAFGTGRRPARRRPRRSHRARSTPCSAPTAPASRRWSRSSPACSAPTPARSPSTASRRRVLRRPSDAQAAGLAPVFQDPALAPDLTVAQNLRLTGADIDAVRAELAGDGPRRPRPRRAGPRRAAAVPAHARPRPGAGVRPAAAGARRDHRRPAARPVRAGLRRDAAVEGAQPLGAVHLPPPGRGARRTATCAPCCATDATSRRSCPARAARRRSSSAMLGEAAAGRPRRGADAGDGDRPSAQRPILEAEHVGAGRQLDDVSLAVAPGEVLGLVALEGQGQETLFDILAGNRKADRGRAA